MRIIARRTLREFVATRSGHQDQAALRNALEAWRDEGRRARWTGTADVKRHYRAASVVSADRIVFHIKGNDDRLVATFDFEKGSVWIKWIGSHTEYDRIDVMEVEYRG